MYDVAIIGGGVIGCAVARVLSRYNVRTVIIEKGNDVSIGASKANSGIVHGGYTASHGTLKGELSIAGNRLFDELNHQLNFGFSRIGSLVLGFSEQDEERLEALRRNGEANGVRGLAMLTRRQLRAMEPNVSDEAFTALYCPETGITSPYEFCIALAENAVHNGVDLMLESEVTNIEKRGDRFRLQTPGGTVDSAFVVNAAGINSDRIGAMLGDERIALTPRKGQYLILQRGTGKLAQHVLFQPPSDLGKGILVTSTYWGNLMLGPNSQEIPDKEDTATDREILSYIVKNARKSLPGFDIVKTIRTFSGVRATSTDKDFIIRPGGEEGALQLAGIDSPGLTAAPAIAEKAADMLREMGLDLSPNPRFTVERPPINTPRPLAPYSEIKERIELPEGNPERIVCRCEQVSEAVIVDALNRGIPVTSLDGVKRRTRAGMGPCQGQFCAPRVRALVARERDIAEEKVTGRGEGSGPLPERVGAAELRKLEE